MRKCRSAPNGGHGQIKVASCGCDDFSSFLILIIGRMGCHQRLEKGLNDENWRELKEDEASMVD